MDLKQLIEGRMQRIDFPIINNDSSIFVQANEYFYYKDMKKSSELKIFEERLIIYWGKSSFISASMV